MKKGMIFSPSPPHPILLCDYDESHTLSFQVSYLNLTLHNSLIVFRGIMYHTIIFFNFRNLVMMGSTHVMYCEFFNKEL